MRIGSVMHCCKAMLPVACAREAGPAPIMQKRLEAVATGGRSELRQQQIERHEERDSHRCAAKPFHVNRVFAVKCRQAHGSALFTE